MRYPSNLPFSSYRAAPLQIDGYVVPFFFTTSKGTSRLMPFSTTSLNAAIAFSLSCSATNSTGAIFPRTSFFSKPAFSAKWVLLSRTFPSLSSIASMSGEVSKNIFIILLFRSFSELNGMLEI